MAREIRVGAQALVGWSVAVLALLGWAGSAAAQLPSATAVDGFPRWFLGTVIAVLCGALAIAGSIITWAVAKYFAELQRKLLELDQIATKVDQLIDALPDAGGIQRVLGDHEARLAVVETRCDLSHGDRRLPHRKG